MKAFVEISHSSSLAVTHLLTKLMFLVDCHCCCLVGLQLKSCQLQCMQGKARCIKAEPGRLAVVNVLVPDVHQLSCCQPLEPDHDWGV